MPWKPLDALVVFLLPWVVLPIAFYLALAIAAPFNADVATLLDRIDQGDVVASFSLVVLDAAASFILIGRYLRRHNQSWRDLGLRTFNILKALGIFVLIAISFIGLVWLAYEAAQALIPGFNPDEAQTNEFTSPKPGLELYSILALVVLPPIIEEIVFRGFIFPAFATRFGIVAGALLSSLLFGFAHLQLNVAIYTFIVGLLLCVLYRYTGSIIPGIAVHMINNYIAYTALS